MSFNFNEHILVVVSSSIYVITIVVTSANERRFKMFRSSAFMNQCTSFGKKIDLSSHYSYIRTMPGK